MPECVILIGLPGAGKTTYYRDKLASTHKHISKDLWPNAKGRDARLRREIEEALAQGVSVAIDNVNGSTADRAPLIALARQYGARVIGYYFEVTTRQAVARNDKREGRAKVPKVAIFTAAKRLQPPQLDEGFDELVQIAPRWTES